MRSATEREPIQTLIFMDFETAGKLLETEFAGDLQPRNAGGLDPTDFLDKLLKSDFDLSRVPRIAEMSFVFVPRALFLEASESMHHKLLKHENEGRQGEPLKIDIPCNVLTSQMNPELSEEDWALYESKRASIRLRRSELAEKNTFAQEWPAVQHMLRISPKPACLIAHNGLQFDFRILCHELARTGFVGAQIPEGVFFLDSYLTFLDIEEAHHRTIQQTLDTIDWKIIDRPAAPPHQPMSTFTSSSSQITEEEEQQQQKSTTTQPADEAINTTTTTISSGGSSNSAEMAAPASLSNEEDEILVIAADCPLAEHCPPSPAYSATSSVIDEDLEQQREKEGKQREALQLVQQMREEGQEGPDEKEEEEIMIIGHQRASGSGGGQRRNGCSQQQIGTATICNTRKRRLFPSSLSTSVERLDPRHPFRYLRLADWCPAKRRRIPPHIFEKDPHSGQWRFSAHSSERLLRRCGQFKLPNMFRTLIGADFRAHRAQADSEALLQVCLAYGADFMAQMDQKRAAFPEISE